MTLADYATPAQAKYLAAVEAHGSARKAATALGVTRQTIDGAVKRAKAAAALQGFSPDHGMTKTVPDGFRLKGVSTLYDADGKISVQWVKSTADLERQQEIMREAYAAMAEELPREQPIPAPGGTEAHLANVYTLTDSHVGMLAWHREGGADWDLKIAEQTLVGCFQQMVKSSPPARVGIVAQLGDWAHYDSAVNPVTPMHGHILDADGRMPKMVATAIRILRRVITFALLKHDKVVVLLAEGNHDMASSVWLRAMFAALYENEPRVEVIDSELPYYVYQHGETMLAWHHGHLRKNDQLPLLFAAQFPKMWGNTTKRYAHCGHRHHVEEKEHSGMTVVQHSTLAARDAFAARGGWMSERQCKAITYHSQYGEVARSTVTPEMMTAG